MNTKPIIFPKEIVESANKLKATWRASLARYAKEHTNPEFEIILEDIFNKEKMVQKEESVKISDFLKPYYAMHIAIPKNFSTFNAFGNLSKNVNEAKFTALAGIEVTIKAPHINEAITIYNSIDIKAMKVGQNSKEIKYSVNNIKGSLNEGLKPIMEYFKYNNSINEINAKNCDFLILKDCLDTNLTDFINEGFEILIDNFKKKLQSGLKVENTDESPIITSGGEIGINILNKLDFIRKELVDMCESKIVADHLILISAQEKIMKENLDKLLKDSELVTLNAKLQSNLKTNHKINTKNKV